MAESIICASKLCTKCGIVKQTDGFAKSKSRKDGLNGHCKACISAWRIANIDSVREKSRFRHIDSREHNNARTARWRDQNKEYSKEYMALWIVDNKHRKVAVDKRWREENKDVLRDRYRPRKIENIRRRYAQKIGAMPKWANPSSIRSIYESAADMRLAGLYVEVDHIVPLLSDFVCGLHCEANLQIIGGEENRSKGNRWWPDMPE